MPGASGSTVVCASSNSSEQHLRPASDRTNSRSSTGPRRARRRSDLGRPAAHVAALRGRRGALGVERGRPRVAYMPTWPNDGAFLSTASIGAIWSSAGWRARSSSRSVNHRFGQSTEGALAVGRLPATGARFHRSSRRRAPGLYADARKRPSVLPYAQPVSATARHLAACATGMILGPSCSLRPD